MTSNDMVNHPQHYFADNGMEAIDVIEAFFHDNYFLGNVFKYMARAGKKENTTLLQDLKKAKVYLDREVEKVRFEQETAAALAIQGKINELLSEPQPEYTYGEFFSNVSVPPQPRVFNSLDEVPNGVLVVDDEGDYWRFDNEGNRWLSFDEGVTWDIEDTAWDDWAPFTEVLDD